MPHEEPRIIDTRDWLTKAEIDYRAGLLDLDADPPIIEDALFHSQQVVEKTFKAFLTFHDCPFKKTHNLETLGHECMVVDSSLGAIVKECAVLSTYAWVFRYPGEVEIPSLDEARPSLSLARRTRCSVCSIYSAFRNI
jgi:HEPN domain-containing protein